MLWALFLLALLAGAAMPLQAAINAALARYGTGAIWAALVSFGVGTFVLSFYVLLLRHPWPSQEMLRQAPWWAWCGGCLGAFHVAAAIYLAPRIGATALMASLMTGLLITSLLLDHFGLFSLPQHPINGPRVLGVLLLFAGILLIRYF